MQVQILIRVRLLLLILLSFREILVGEVVALIHLLLVAGLPFPVAAAGFGRNDVTTTLHLLILAAEPRACRDIGHLLTLLIVGLDIVILLALHTSGLIGLGRASTGRQAVRLLHLLLVLVVQHHLVLSILLDEEHLLILAIRE